MNAKRLYTPLIICMCALCASAQFEKKNSDEPKYQGPDLQTIDDGFFDPTKKPKRDYLAEYKFGVDYRLTAGYIQHDLRFPRDTAHYGYLHGMKLGLTVDFRLPYDFSIQTGLIYQIAAGNYEQHLRSMQPIEIFPYSQKEVIYHNQIQHMLVLPIRLYYDVPLPKGFGLFFYTGPQIEIGLAWQDQIETSLSSDPVGGKGTLEWAQQRGIPTESYDRYQQGECSRFLIQYGVGGGVEWDFIRLEAGYDFGLNNIMLRSVNDQRVWQWTWNVGLSFRLNPRDNK